MTQHFSRVSIYVQFFVRSNNTSVFFIGELARYSSSGTLGRNYTRCKTLPALNSRHRLAGQVLLNSWIIRYALWDHRYSKSIYWWGVDNDQRNMLQLILFLHYVQSFLVFKVITLPLYSNNSYHIASLHKFYVVSFCFLLYSYLSCTCLCPNEYYIYTCHLVNCNMMGLLSFKLER